MPKIVISDTTPLIIFQKLGELDILKKVYGHLITTPEIAKEYGDLLPDWIEVIPVTDTKYINFLATQLDIGEASALALAAEMENVLLIIDDLKARKIARRLNFDITGTLGVIHKAKQMSIIEKVKPLIDKMVLTDFRISKNIIRELLKLNNEL
jgi:predicted nucleic acid-binding protein